MTAVLLLTAGITQLILNLGTRRKRSMRNRDDELYDDDFEDNGYSVDRDDFEEDAEDEDFYEDEEDEKFDIDF